MKRNGSFWMALIFSAVLRGYPGRTRDTERLGDGLWRGRPDQKQRACGRGLGGYGGD